MAITVRKANADDSHNLAQVLARAFADDPVMRWFLPSPDARAVRLPRLFAMQLECLYLRWDAVYTTTDVVGAAMWAPPDRWHTPPGAALRTLPRLAWTLRGRLSVAIRCVAAIEARHPLERHWYLAIVGTEPARQHNGVGSALLDPVLQRCDRERLPAYLESSREENVAFYRRLGFEETGVIDLPGGGPRVWPMWREPRP